MNEYTQSNDFEINQEPNDPGHDPSYYEAATPYI